MSRAPSSLPLAAAVLAAAATLAACGSQSSGSSSSSGSGGPPTGAQAQSAPQDAIRFARCMRSHGIPNFPDPTSDGGFDKSVLRQLGVSDARMRAIGQVCGPVNGGGSGQSSASGPPPLGVELAFVRCIRSHGFPRFPDPTSSGQLTHQMLANAGIDVHLPAVVQAADACVTVTHGYITKAAVARFAAGH